jgi:hypothetical protein
VCFSKVRVDVDVMYRGKRMSHVARVRGWRSGKEGRNLHCCLILTKTDVVLCNFDERIGCSVMIVTKCRLIMQQGFVMIGQTIVHRFLTGLRVPKSVKESTGSVQR